MSQEVPENKDVLRVELKELRARAHNKDMMGFYERMLEFVGRVESKYPDCRSYELFHLLIGSTPLNPTKFDFPGEDSIEKFLREQE
ncbi:MAG: hypothetical protein CEO12_391 [Parcubacteria group bacterium Gr01-1014_46]|nr:MAG: hypothetical protein CEO12_391 [Parcubacteria group bacterium Gr01-1014_46]